MQIRGVLLSCALLAGCASAERGPITAVTVRDGAFQVVKELSPTEVATFDAMWAVKVKVSEEFGVTDKNHYKLDIAGGNDPGRWLYKPNGYTSELDPMVQPVFKVQDAESFNRLIGATK